MKYRIVYNFVFNNPLKVYIPEALICSTTANGHLHQRYKRAIPETLESFSSLHYEDTPHENALSIIELLSEAALVKKFKPKGRRKVDFKVIAEENDAAKLCKKFIQKQVDKLLRICKTNNYAVTRHLEKKVAAEKYRLRFSDKTYIPRLAFKKTNNGIEYALALTLDGVPFYPSAIKTFVINNAPSWVSLGNHLVHIPDINGNKLKPFINKTSIHIPARTTKIYFEKFILDLVQKLDVHTEGFEVIEKDELLKTKLTLTENLFSGESQLKLVFIYDHHKFTSDNPIRNKTSIHFLENDDVIIINQKRDQEKEKQLLQKLVSLGLSLTESNNLKTSSGKKHELLEWLTLNKKSIVRLGIICEDTIDYGDKKITLKPYNLEVNYLKENDWFDVSGYVRIGKQDVPFIDLLKNVREEDPYFLLEDGTYFIIPPEWMTKYSSLLKFGIEEGGRFKIAKSQYGLLEELNPGNTETASISKILIDDLDIPFQPSPLLKAQLRPYQTDGVKWLLKHQHNGLGACLADDMGLGKTLQVIATLVHTKETLALEATQKAIPKSPKDQQLSMFESNYEEELQPLKALVVVPASLIFNWLAELQKFAPHLKATSYIGAQRKQRKDLLKIYDVVITTYHTALRDIELLKKTNWTYTILDESQYIKNRNSKIFQGLAELVSDYKISLSGTPIENSLSDLWSQMEFINPEILGTFEFFRNNFKIPIEKNGDEHSIAELKSIVDPFLLRRTKEQVAKDLPPLIEQLMKVDMVDEQKKLFEREKSAARNRILGMDQKEKGFKFHVFKELMALRKIANHPVLFDETYLGRSGKLDLVIDKMMTLIRSNHKILIFSAFTSYLGLVKKILDTNKLQYAYLTGAVTQKKRKEAVRQFQEDPNVQVFLISIKAGGVGLNLTEADYVFILDPWWNPFVEQQAVARAHRIGQDKTVNVIKFISTDSIEEKILKLQDKKIKLNDDILSESTLESLSSQDVNYLLDI